MAIVTFDVDEFREVYPQFANVSDTALNFNFNLAEQHCDNTDSSPVDNVEKRKMLLYLLVCHITTLSLRGEETVGALQSATEGSVSASFATPTVAGAEYYSQTQCGLNYWQLSAMYRMGFYVAGKGFC